VTFNPFDELFSENDPVSTDASPETAPPQSRREARAREAGAPLTAPVAVLTDEPPSRRNAALVVEPHQRRKRTGLWVGLSILLVFLLAVGGFGLWAWTTYQDQIRDLFGWSEPNDYVGAGTDEVLITIQDGDIGSDVAMTLAQNDVVKTYEAFYDLLLVQDPQVNFFPGTYSLKKQMSAQLALDALNDPANKLVQTVLIPEGKTIWETYELLAAGTGLTVADFEAADDDLASFGLPAQAVNLDGYLFPAQYTFEPGLDARAILQQLVDRTVQSLDAAGVAPEDRFAVLTLASIIQREAGSNPDDFYKVSRVFTNRLDTPGWKLQSDATVAYGTGNTHTVWTTDAERADAANLYNTYVHEGLPVGPIGAAGDLAIDAALHPVDGPWYFFVPVNLATGETVFSETESQHEAAAEQLRDWCRASDENAAYCD